MRLSGSTIKIVHHAGDEKIAGEFVAQISHGVSGRKHFRHNKWVGNDKRVRVDRVTTIDHHVRLKAVRRVNADRSAIEHKSTSDIRSLYGAVKSARKAIFDVAMDNAFRRQGDRHAINQLEAIRPSLGPCE
jgi:hypothetical protein